MINICSIVFNFIRGFHKLDEIGKLCQHWHQRLYYVKTKNSSNKILPPVSIEPLAQDSKSSMPPLP